MACGDIRGNGYLVILMDDPALQEKRGGVEENRDGGKLVEDGEDFPQVFLGGEIPVSDGGDGTARKVERVQIPPAFYLVETEGSEEYQENHEPSLYFQFLNDGQPVVNFVKRFLDDFSGHVAVSGR